MREEYELEVLEQYNIEVKGTRRIRGAFFCDTNLYLQKMGNCLSLREKGLYIC